MVFDTVSDYVNILAFLGLTLATYIVFFFGKDDKRRGVNFNTFTLSLGINLIGFSQLFRIWSEIPQNLLLATVGGGSLFILLGVTWVFYDKKTETRRLKKREDEINSIIKNLKEKYYQQDLSEDELKTAFSGLLTELAEIEVKLGKNAEHEEKKTEENPEGEKKKAK